MDTLELLDIVSSGETSKVQFKEIVPNQHAMAAEMIATSNTHGGMILIGIVDKTGEINGLSSEQIRDDNSRISDIATNIAKPPIFVTTEVVRVGNGEVKKVLVVHVPEGINKPYKDNNGTIWVKQGADKRKLTDNAEILRLFQQGGSLTADEMEVFESSIEGVEKKRFEDHFLKEFDKSISEG